MEKQSGVEIFLEVINASGVEHVFFNPGIDNVPMLEIISKHRSMGKTAPRGILCLDESVAMAAAHGNYMASGKPQVVLVHSELGTQQVGGALHNAQWGRIPVVLCAESRGPAQRVNWLKEPFDQGTMVRNFVKWDHQMTGNEDIGDVLQKAFRIAMTEPCGPVYIAFQRETMTREYNRTAALSAAVEKTPALQADSSDLQKIARLLLDAADPLIVTGYSGRHHKSAAALQELAETLCARVFSTEVTMNFPTTHPLSISIEPGDNRSKAFSFFSEADVILAIDYDMPYAPPRIILRPDVKIIHIDIDTAKQGVPLWNRAPDILIKADSSQAVPALTEIIRQNMTPEQRQRLQERFSRLESSHNMFRKKWQHWSSGKSEQKPIATDWLCHCINEVISEDTVIVNQTISSSMSMAYNIHRTKPGTIHSCAGGSIGWALGAALGVKVSTPDEAVVSLMGDGAFVYGCPVATLWSADYYHAPFLSVIFNNQSYGAIKGLFQNVYDGENMGADISPSPDFALVAQACKAYGRTVVDPVDVIPALREALDHVRGGQAAVVDVRLIPA